MATGRRTTACRTALTSPESDWLGRPCLAYVAEKFQRRRLGLRLQPGARLFWFRKRVTVRIADVAWHSLAGPLDRPSSECLDGQRKHIADAAFGQDDARRVWIGLQLAPQAQYLHVDTTIEDIFMDPGRLQKVFAGKRSLRRVEKRNQQRILAFGQRDRDSVGISEPPDAPIELPAAKSAAPSRSEERRVGKERGSRWSPNH